MVWNASRPADSDRIRLSAGLIRDNWQAIETGTVPYDTISLQNQAVLPPLAGHNRLYGYTNANSGQIELYSVNPANQGVLLTEGGRLGSINQNAVFANTQTATFTLGSIPNPQNAFCNAWVSFDDSGNILQSYNVSSMNHNSLGTGLYRVNLSYVASNANYCVLALASSSNSDDHTRVAQVVSQTTSNVIVRFQRTNQDGSYQNTGGYIAIFGGR